MILVITSIVLKHPLGFFKLSAMARHIVKQLKDSNCSAYKARGFWTKHYTMTLWDSETDMKSFAQSGAHLDSMKNSNGLYNEIRTVTIASETLISWKAAKNHLDNGKAFMTKSD